MKTLDAIQLTDILGDCLKNPIPSDITVHRICTDSRTIVKGDAFAALSGENFNGHCFVEEAVKNGASVLITEHLVESKTPQIVVENTRLGLAKIASAIRNDFVARGGKVIGITGSVGKTTNKQMLASILSQQGRTHATKGNLNNELGVPFTWFDLPDDAEFAVIEMGASHQGEIDYLSQITRPHVAMITNAGEAHLEGFGGLEGVAKGKGEIFKHLSPNDTAVINLDDKNADYWHTLISENVNAKTFSLNSSNANVYASDINQDCTQFTLNTPKGKITINLPIPGLHTIMNALGATACALALDITLSNIAQGLRTFSGAKGRLQVTKIGALTIIDDTYNANPLSMRASATILASKKNYKVMVIGDMGELGEQSHQLHADLGRALQEKADTFFCLGKHMSAFVANNPRATHFDDMKTLTNELAKLIEKQTNTTVLVKGSRSMQMERVIKFLQQK